ncbi:MAG: winged helix-turn-helix domain-containing protein [Candidatus Pacebacteria bacterium]|nr:winged helix-turn-helix domain-containing protein [Candidatus Paceibacterota bacterium]
MTTNYRKIEGVVKGFANHRRLQIMELLQEEPELSVDDIAEKLRIGYKNTSDHIRKMAIAGLVLKRNDGPYVRHKLAPRGENILAFCKKLK